MKLWVARHGETEWNRDGRMQGRHGGKLTEKGRAQARALGEAALGLGVRRIVASPLARAQETARIVAGIAGCPVRTAEVLMETDFGACSGLTEAQIEERFPGLRAERERDKWRHRWPGGESYADMAERLLWGCAVLGEEDTLVIAHQSMNRVIAHLFAPAPVNDVLRMAQPSDVVLRVDGTGFAAHAWLTSPAQWVEGLYFSAAPRLN